MSFAARCTPVLTNGLTLSLARRSARSDRSVEPTESISASADISNDMICASIPAPSRCARQHILHGPSRPNSASPASAQHGNLHNAPAQELGGGEQRGEIQDHYTGGDEFHDQHRL